MHELYLAVSQREGATAWCAQCRTPTGETSEHLGRQHGLSMYRARLLALVRGLSDSPEGDVHVHAGRGSLPQLVDEWLPSWRARDFRKKGGIRDVDLVKRLDALLETRRIHWATAGTDGGRLAQLKRRLEEARDEIDTLPAVVPTAAATEATVLVYTDGGCRGNPGPGGWGAVLVHVPTGQSRILRGGASPTTNNAMELTAAVRALQTVRGAQDIEVRTDSQYVIQCASEWLPGWRRRGYARANDEPLLNRELIIALDEAQQPHRVRWTWVRGHAGEPGNELVDTLASRAIDSIEQGLDASLDQRTTEPPFAISALASTETR